MRAVADVRRRELVRLVLTGRWTASAASREMGMCDGWAATTMRRHGIDLDRARARVWLGTWLALSPQGVSVKSLAEWFRVSANTLSVSLREMGEDPTASYNARRSTYGDGETKTCKACGEPKPLGEFYLKRNAARGTQKPIGRCKPCELERTKKNKKRLRAEASPLRRLELRHGKEEGARRYAARLKREDRYGVQKAIKRVHANLAAFARAARKAVKERRRRTIDAMVARLISEDPTARRLGRDAQEYRARYRYDANFRAKELKRRYQQKTAAPIPSDGSLDGNTLRVLFSAAKRCPLCRRPMASQDKTLDHIHPKSRGGIHSVLNARVVCRSCNTRKRAALPEQCELGASA